MKQLPPLRVFAEDDGFLVITRDDSGRWHTLDEDSRMSWTDEEAEKAIPLAAATDVVVVARENAAGLFDVDINGRPAAVSVPELTAGMFAISAALQTEAPITLIADDGGKRAAKYAGAVQKVQRLLGVVPNGG